jgi:DNA polymerase-4/DNA polymerase V
MLRPVCITSFPQAVLHVDGDAFFASCEQIMHKELTGKPVVTGLERGIASSMSYEAKARGVTRGMPVHEIRRVCPECVLLASDYETYSLFSLRMYEIVRRYTDVVEEYSIDECFANITGMRRALNMTYTQIVEAVKHDLDSELGVTFSVGLAPSKVLAKVASKWKKPSGLTIIPGVKAHRFLKDLPVDKLWGIGVNTGSYLRNQGVRTALDFAYKPIKWVEMNLSKPYQEIWHELHGKYIYPVDNGKRSPYKSISKTRTFTPPSDSKDFVFSQLSKNVENACIKARRHNLSSKRFSFFLKTQDFQFQSMQIDLSKPVSTPENILEVLEPAFDRLYTLRTLYRGTGFFLLELGPNKVQPDLFGGHVEVERMEKVYASIDEINQKYGKHTIFTGSSFIAHKKGLHENERSDLPDRRSHLLKGETFRKRLGIPLIGEVG